MKQLILTLMLCLAGLALQAQERDKQQIRDLLETQRQAWNRGDLEGFMEGYLRSDQLLFVGSNGPKYGWTTTLENYRKSYPDRAAMGQLEFDIREIRMLNSKHAFVLGGWKLIREKDTPAGFFTLLLQKIKGRWVVVADHSS